MGGAGERLGASGSELSDGGGSMHFPLVPGEIRIMPYFLYVPSPPLSSLTWIIPFNFHSNTMKWAPHSHFIAVETEAC